MLRIVGDRSDAEEVTLDVYTPEFRAGPLPKLHSALRGDRRRQSGRFNQYAVSTRLNGSVLNLLQQKDDPLVVIAVGDVESLRRGPPVPADERNTEKKDHRARRSHASV